MMMTRHKLRPRVLNTGQSLQPNNFFYRLVTSQRFLVIIGLSFLILILFPLAKTYSQRKLVEQEINEVKKEISDFESKNQELKEMINYLQSDQSLEEQARLNLNLKKPGETVIVINEKKIATSTVNTDDEAKDFSNLKKWWYYFFD